MRLRLWADPSRLVCTIVDQGPGFDDRLLGYSPPSGDLRGGAGLWLARRSCDRVETFRPPGGFGVRLVLALPMGHGPAELEGARARVEIIQRKTAAAGIRAAQLRREVKRLGSSGQVPG
nr:hypothetical protein GCM10020093_018220 [Planobispora longispora]